MRRIVLLGLGLFDVAAPSPGVDGRTAEHRQGQADEGTVLRSQPGEADYNPLWKEVWLFWKKGVKPVLIGQDDQIDALEQKGKLTEKDAHIVLNAPILKVGKGG